MSNEEMKYLIKKELRKLYGEKASQYFKKDFLELISENLKETRKAIIKYETGKEADDFFSREFFQKYLKEMQKIIKNCINELNKENVYKKNVIMNLGNNIKIVKKLKDAENKEISNDIENKKNDFNSRNDEINMNNLNQILMYPKYCYELQKKIHLLQIQNQIEFNYALEQERENKLEETVIASDFSKMYKNDTQYYATFLDSTGKPLAEGTTVKFNINGVFYTRSTNANGVAKMNINLNPNKYILTATNPVTGENKGTTINVLSTITENYDLTKYYKNDSQYRVRLLDSKGNPVGAGVKIEFNINGVFYTRTSDENGYVKMNINLNPGTYIITGNYNGLMASNIITVKPILEAKDLNMKYKDGSKFETKLVDGTGKPYADQTITFNINGVFYSRTTDTNGIARLNINLMAGEYIITSMYSNGAAIANKVTISS